MSIYDHVKDRSVNVRLSLLLHVIFCSWNQVASAGSVCEPLYTECWPTVDIRGSDLQTNPSVIPTSHWEGINEISPWIDASLTITQILDINRLLFFDQWTYDEINQVSVPPQFEGPSASNLERAASILLGCPLDSLTYPDDAGLDQLTNYLIKRQNAWWSGQSFSKNAQLEAEYQDLVELQSVYVRVLKGSIQQQAMLRQIPANLMTAMTENESTFNANYIAEAGEHQTVGLLQLRWGDDELVPVPGVIGNLERFGYLPSNQVNDSMLFDPFINIAVAGQKLVMDFETIAPSNELTWAVALTNYSPVYGYVEKTAQLMDVLYHFPELMCNEVIYFKDQVGLVTSTGYEVQNNNKNEELQDFKIYDLRGSLIGSYRATNKEHIQTAMGLKPGCYLISMKNNNVTKAQKIVFH